MRAVVEDFEEDGWEEAVGVCDWGWGGCDLEDGFECEPELADGEVFREDLFVGCEWRFSLGMGWWLQRTAKRLST